jgi:hypothetical protein
MGAILRTLIRMRGSLMTRRFDSAADRLEDTQRAFLLNLIRTNAETAFGKDHGFVHIRTEADYRRQVPVRDYEGFRPYVNRIIVGESAVLTAIAPQMLNMTSGTTGEPKYIPVTPDSLRHSTDYSVQWISRALRDHPTLLNHAFVAIVSRATEGRMPSGLPFGSASGMIYQRIPRPIRAAYAIPYLVSEIRDYDRRYFVAVRLAMGARVSYIGTPNPSTLVRLAETGIQHAEAIIRAIHEGTLGIALPDQPEIASLLAARLTPDPKRAKVLAKIVERTGALRPADCWPDLSLIGCWLGGSVGTQARRVSAYYGEVPMRDLGYLASEGHFTLPHQDHTSSGILLLRTNYYEFIPENTLNDSHPTVFSSHELDPGGRYAVLLTSAGGLYRYDIHDIVQVTGFYRNTPLLAFIRKGRDMTSITGEKMHANHLLLALELVRKHYDVSLVEQFRVVANVEERRYDIYAEFKTEVSHDRLRDEVLPDLDRMLAQVNVEYAEKRRSRRLAPPCLHLMRPGWADREYRRGMAAGKRDTQYKWQILCPEPRPEDTEAILSTITVEKDDQAGDSLPVHT